MKKRRRLQESLFAKLFFSLLFVLLAAGAAGGILFLRSAWQDGAQRGDIQSEAMERALLSDAQAVAEYAQLFYGGNPENGYDPDYLQSRREELAARICLDSPGNFIWQFYDETGALLLGNLADGETLAAAAGDNALRRDPVELVEYTLAEDGTAQSGVLRGELAYSLRAGLPYADGYRELQAQAAAVRSAADPVLVLTIAAAVLCILLFSFLTAAAGRKAGCETAALNAFDKVWLEIPILLVGLVLCFWIPNWRYPNAAMQVLLTACLSGGVLATVMTAVRRHRAGCLFSTTFLHLAWRFLRTAVQHIHIVGRIVALLVLYVAAQLVLVLLMGDGSLLAGFVWAMGNLSIAALAVVVAVQYGKIKKATEKMAKGELGVVIDEKEVPFFRQIAHNLNNSGSAIRIAVDRATQSERMKTELITNVSHDIKTPLTSIINYAGLLRTTGITDPKALEYVDVLEHKSKRLAQLVADLVEASKVASGAVGVSMESINLSELVKQAGGEFEARFEERGIQLMCRMPDQPVLAYADGRHMWRVLDNLFGNAVKYALDNTRIYVDLADLGNEVVLSMKNISRDPLNIKPDELMERFVRGDQARVGEGSGLGLSIARSLMELQNGSLDIQIDGDLFKVLLVLRKL